MHIEAATAADWPALNRIYRDARRACFLWVSADRIGDADLERDAEGEIIHVARDAGEVIGFISVWAPDRFVHHLYVDVAHHRRGVGTRLLAFARATYPPPLRLKCVARNAPALRFYKREGWRAVGEGSDAGEAYLVLESPPELPVSPRTSATWA